MKKLIAIASFIVLGMLTAQAQDSSKTSTVKEVKHKIKKGAHATTVKTKSVIHKGEKKGKKLGAEIDTTAKKTGHGIKKVSNEVASTIVTSKDKSLKGPNGEAVYNGPRGGKYYIAKDGKKVYLKKDKAKM